MSNFSPGIVQIYTGNGKGKTTAAIGLAVRALGHGYKVAFIQFMKNSQQVGEILALQSFANCHIRSFGSGKWVHKGKLREEDITEAANALAYCRELIHSQVYDLVVVDEIINAIWFELINESDVLDLMAAKPDGVEIVLTGRNASERLREAAGLVTEMCLIKHPYEQGINARKGIEF